MSVSYEDYEREYNATLSRIRSFLAGTRSKATLSECDRLLQDAKQSATAMQALAEVEGDNPDRIREAKMRLERDIGPLAKEVQRALQQASGREELFYQSPDVEQAHGNFTDMDSLIQSSDDLLRESQMILAETEHIGTNTLMQMGRQREQLQSTNSNLEAVQNVAMQAKRILSAMSRRALKNKLCLYLLITMLSAANIYVLFLIHKKHTKTEKKN